MIRSFTIALILIGCALPASAQKIVLLGDHEFQAEGATNCNRDMCVKQGLGLSNTIQDIEKTVDKAVNANILTKVQADAYLKRLDDISEFLHERKRSGEKVSFGELDWTAKQLAALSDDINRKLNINRPMLATNPDYLKEQYSAFKTRISGALNIGRLEGSEAKAYRSEAKKIMASTDMNDEKAVEDASRRMSRLTSKLQIATARSRSTQATNSTSRFAIGPRAF